MMGIRHKLIQVYLHDYWKMIRGRERRFESTVGEERVELSRLLRSQVFETCVSAIPPLAQNSELFYHEKPSKA